MPATHLAGPVPAERSPRSTRGRADHGYVSDVRLPVVLAVGVLILVVAVVAIRLAYGSTSSDTRPRALVLGDSITDHGQRVLRDTIGPLYLLSIEGQDNFRVDDQLPVAQRWATRDFSQVVINLGTNDVVQGWPIDQSTAGLEQIVSLFPEANCIHLTTVSESLPGRTSSTAADAAELNAAIRSMAESNSRVRIVDWNAIVDEQQAQGIDLTTDGVHPTTEGQQLLVDAYEASMTACPDD
jgi:hypothetical protein